MAQIPATVVVTPAFATLIPGAQLAFTAAAVDGNANPISDPNVTWSSTDVTVASITGTGLATAVAAGTTTVIATAGPAADTANVTVVVVTVDSVDVSPDSLSLSVGGSGNVSARFFDAAGTEILGPTATWASTDTAVATVTSTGVVTGVAPGTAWVRGTEDDGADSTYVTVTTVSLFDVEVRFVGTLPSASVQTAFSDAESRWEELLIGDLPAVAVTLAAAACSSVAHPAVAETIDDVIIFAEVTAIDGSGGILGQAGPCVVRTTGNLALLGIMQLDEADLSDLEASSDLVETIIHEMGHVLGFGGSSPELCVKVRGSSSMLRLGCLGDLLGFEKREIEVAAFAPDRSSPQSNRGDIERSALARSGKAPALRIRRLISVCRRSRLFVVRSLAQWGSGNA